MSTSVDEPASIIIPDSESGISECFKNFGNLKCVQSPHNSLSLTETCCIFIMFFAALAIFNSIKLRIQVFRHIKYYVITSLALACLFQLLFSLTKKQPIYYFLQFYFQSCFTCFLIYYFGKKASFRNQPLELYVYAIFIALMLSNTLMLFFLTVKYNEKENYNLCTGIYLLWRQKKKETSFTLIRTLGLISQIVFALIACILTRKVRQEIRIHQALLMNDNDKRSFARTRSQLKQLRVLVVTNLVGGFIQFCKNIIYWANQKCDNNCRIIPHVGGNQKNDWSDNFDATIRFFIDLISFYIPFILTLFLFKRKMKQDVMEEPEPEYQNNYFEGLSILSPQQFSLQQDIEPERGSMNF